MRIRFTNAAHTAGLMTLDGGVEVATPLPPNDPDLLAAYIAAIAAGVVVEPFDPGMSAFLAGCLEAEYLRRLVVLLGARDLAHAGFIRADDADETAMLSAVATRTDEQSSRLAELLARRAAVNALIEAYNRMPEPLPADYTADHYWS